MLIYKYTCTHIYKCDPHIIHFLCLFTCWYFHVSPLMNGAAVNREVQISFWNCVNPFFEKHLIGHFLKSCLRDHWPNSSIEWGKSSVPRRTIRTRCMQVTNVSFCGTLLRCRNCKLRRKHISSISHLCSFPLSTQHSGAHVPSTIPLTDLLYEAEVRKRKKEGGKKQGPTLESRMICIQEWSPHCDNIQKNDKWAQNNRWRYIYWWVEVSAQA